MEIAGLSPQTNRVGQLVLQVYSNREIADALGIKVRTVKTHTWRLYLYAGLMGSKNKRARFMAMYANSETAEGEIPHLQPLHWKVVYWLGQGMHNAEIGSNLRLTEQVVKNYLRTVYDVLGLWNRKELTLWYLAHREQVAAAITITSL